MPIQSRSSGPSRLAKSSKKSPGRNKCQSHNIKLISAFVSCVPSRPASECPDDVTVYLVVNDFGSLDHAFVETDIAEADREAVIRNFLSGQYSNAFRVVAFDTGEGWSRDVSEDIAGEWRLLADVDWSAERKRSRLAKS
jgi:hypothetical protein